jgi:hypothetical protein
MKINEVTNKKIEPSKPRNFVAKNMTTGGAGAHRDKKKEQKQGQEKHKGKQYDMSESEHKPVHKPGHKVGHWKQAILAKYPNAQFKDPRHAFPKDGSYHWIALVDGEQVAEIKGNAFADMRAHSQSGHVVSEEGEPMKIKAVAGNDVTIDQGGQEIKTTADALTPGQEPGTFTMKPADPNQMKPGATVTQDTETSEDLEYELMPVAPDDNGIHTETDPDLMGSGHNHDIGGDATDMFISQVKDKEFEKAQRGGREGFAGRSKKLGENDELSKMLTIAGLK